jgi:hypothetical protein
LAITQRQTREKLVYEELLPLLEAPLGLCQDKTASRSLRFGQIPDEFERQP